MRSAVVSLFACSAAGDLRSDMQAMLDSEASTTLGLQLGWVSATESFTLAAGSVTNPGQTARAIRPDDTFNYGSGTKATIATAIFRLADAGKIQMHDKASKYVNPFLKRNNGTTLEELYGAQMSNATVLQVLRMEAGLPDFEDARGSSSIDSNALHSTGQIFPPYAWMRAASGQQIPCQPGECSFYSSNSYEIAGLLLTAIQKPDGDWVDLDYADALSGGNKNKYPSMQMPAEQGALKDFMSVAGTSGYSPYQSKVTLWEQNPTIMGWSCGGMMANAGDFSQFFYDLLSPTAEHPLVSNTSLAEMKNLKPLSTGTFKVDYGAGLMDSAPPRYNEPTTKGPDDWGYIIGHIGETFAFHAVNGYMPKAKSAVSIVTNTDMGFSKVNTIACKASEIAAKYAGENVDLQCSSTPSWGRRRRSSTEMDVTADDVIV